jgi:hypothetical protein
MMIQSSPAKQKLGDCDMSLASPTMAGFAKCVTNLRQERNKCLCHRATPLLPFPMPMLWCVLFSFNWHCASNKSCQLADKRGSTRGTVIPECPNVINYHASTRCQLGQIPPRPLPKYYSANYHSDLPRLPIHNPGPAKAIRALNRDRFQSDNESSNFSFLF